MTTAQARLRGIRGERDAIEVPPAALHQLMAELADALNEVSRMRAERAEARQKLTETKEAVTVAESEDRQRLADHRRGKLAKPPKSLKAQAESDLKAAEEQIAVLAVAAADAEQDLRLAIEGNRETIAARLDEEIGKRRKQLRAKVRALAQTEDEFEGVRSLRSWVSEPERGWTSRKFSAPSGIEGPNRESIALGPALAMIEAALAPPIDRPKPEPRPLLRVTR
jgi:chromosome segregation ATPase